MDDDVDDELAGTPEDDGGDMSGYANFIAEGRKLLAVSSERTHPSTHCPDNPLSQQPTAPTTHCPNNPTPQRSNDPTTQRPNDPTTQHHTGPAY